MPKPSDSYNLYVLRPDLAKEWHPTRNGTLGPRKLTPGSRKKVWWLCEHGHWWLASVSDRVHGMRCSYCRELGKKAARLLAEKRPELLKEWHPSRNTDIRAREVSCTYKEKVWWLCNNGHEWQATIRVRLANGTCPFCSSFATPFVLASPKQTSLPPAGRSPEGQLAPLLTEQPSSPPGGVEHRRSKRYVHVGTVMLESPQAGIFGYGQMNNYSASGMLIRSDFPIRTGTLVRIRLESPLYASESKLIDSRVAWCKPLDQDAGGASRYGVGVSFI